jgi:signal transduction histidine kinase
MKLPPLLRRWLRPSLTRRMLLTSVLAFGLVLAVLMANEYRAFRQAGRQQAALLKAGRYLSEALGHAADAQQARLIVRVAETYFNRARDDFATERHRNVGALLFQLRAADGQLLYASAAVQSRRLPGTAGQAMAHEVNGQRHWIVRTTTPHGELWIAEPALADTTVMGWVGADLLPSLALAFPFVLGPLWWAVHRGLGPLRRLAAQLQQRPRDDFSPITQQVRYAELRPLVEAFNAVLLRLRDALQRERAFVQDAAHELRTPMAVIAAQAHVLNAAETPGERAHAAAAMDGALARASHLSSQLLALAALDERRGTRVQPQAVDLAELVQQTLAQATATAEARGLALSLDAPEHLSARLDLGAFQSVLQNLVDNALNYVPRGGRVEVLLAAEGAGWRLRVADDGPGIPPEEQPHVFERFVRGREAQAEGTGLGLAIVRQAVQRLGGSVALQRGLGGRGAAFEVRVPGLQLS